MKSFKFNKNKIKKVKRATFHHSRTSKKIIVLVICALFLYTGMAMWLQYKSGVEISPTLTTCFFAFCTGELWMLANIKKCKLKTGQKDTEYQISEINNNKNNDDDEEPVG